jgi:hypothetical protein
MRARPCPREKAVGWALHEHEEAAFEKCSPLLLLQLVVCIAEKLHRRAMTSQLLQGRRQVVRARRSRGGFICRELRGKYVDTFVTCTGPVPNLKVGSGLLKEERKGCPDPGPLPLLDESEHLLDCVDV